MSKQALIVVLVGVNLLLLGGLILSNYSLPEAKAQPVSLRGEFILISAQAERNNDTIYLLDLARRQMHAFRAQVPQMIEQPMMVRWYHSRDLVRDFR
ncbi:MAG: hypothetical protein QUV05_17820 [Phycisphaerae bacterium]|jgi:hypothetical protein|nr:hypothetical protein [Phycisphaerae bacterium]